jgi:hypothetical protein
MGFECKTDCQLEVSPGVFKHIIAGQTHFDVDKLQPITRNHVKPISRKYFRLTGDDIRLDIQDKSKITAALKKRNIHIPKGSRTADVAKLLAVDNKKRGIVNLESLEVVAAPTHIADKGVIEAKARIDELFELLPSDRNRPYDDNTPLDALRKIIADKEAEIAGAGGESDDEEIAELKKWLDKHKVSYQPNTGIVKLRRYKAEKEEELTAPDSE